MLIKQRGRRQTKLKGISKHVVKPHITFDDYCDSLVDKKIWYHNMRTMRSDKHNIYVEEVNKHSLNPFDDKRYILNDGISTLPYGAPAMVI